MRKSLCILILLSSSFAEAKALPTLAGFQLGWSIKQVGKITKQRGWKLALKKWPHRSRRCHLVEGRIEMARGSIKLEFNRNKLYRISLRRTKALPRKPSEWRKLIERHAKKKGRKGKSFRVKSPSGFQERRIWRGTYQFMIYFATKKGLVREGGFVLTHINWEANADECRA